MPNGVADNDNSDDTLTQVVTSIKQGIIMHIQPQDTTICTGVSVTLDAGAFPSGPLYVWSTGAITRTINVTDAGDYYVKVMNATGCEARDTVHVTVNPSPSAAAVSAIDLGGGDFSFGVIAAEHVDTYQWNFGDGSAPQTGPPPMAHHYTTAGVYAVTLTLINDCGGITISKQVNVEQGTGIAETNALKAAISMYPNPAQDQVTLQAKDGLKINTVAFYDLLGRKVYAVTVNGDKALVNTTALPAGFYQVVIDTDKGRTSKKLAVRK
jgi:PKD repeat protein